MPVPSTPVLGIAAPSGTGKTTLLASLIPLLTSSGLRVGLIKRSHHDFDIDQPGKDSHVLRKAGASTVMLTSPFRRAIITEFVPPHERTLSEELAQIRSSDLDLILVEGYKHERIPKIELSRAALGHSLQAADDSDVIAIASDGPIECPLPVLDLNQPTQIADFILEWIENSAAAPSGQQARPVKHADPCAEPPKAIFSLDEAVARIVSAISPISEHERVPATEGRGRVVAEACRAGIDLPPFANSAMDGYALGSGDLEDASIQAWQVVGKSFAGRPYTGGVGSGQCIRIFTGAVVPAPLDTVVMQEDVIADGNLIRMKRAPKPGSNIRPVGDDAPAGTELIPTGKRLNPADIGLLSSAGIESVAVTRQLRVACLSTGDELAPLGEPLAAGQIYDSNRHQLRALLDQPFIEARDWGIVRDDESDLKRSLGEASSWADMILTSGGVSVGEADLVTSVLADMGRIDFWKIAFKPGKPFAFGRIGNAWFCGLPGNPVAVLVTFLQLVRPALLRLAGARPEPPIRMRAISRSSLRKSPGRMEFQRGQFTVDDQGVAAVSPCGAQGSHRLLGASQANCLIVLAAECAGVSPGDAVTIEPLCELW